MRTAPTYRRGRRIYIPGERRSSLCEQILLAILLLIIPPLLFYHSEQQRYNVYSSLAETIEMDIVDISSSSPRYPPFASKDPVVIHGKSNSIQSTTIDPEMGIQIYNALHLTRNTEYCQWSERQSETCQTCKRKRNKNKRNHQTGEYQTVQVTESYPCDCVKTYHYVKGWRAQKINSMFFDRPAGHYNPQRDPLPRKMFVSNDAVVEFFGSEKVGVEEGEEEHEDDATATAPTSAHESNLNNTKENNENKWKNSNHSFISSLSPNMIQNGIRGAKSRTIKWVRDGIPPITSFWTKWIPDSTRYEDSYNLFQFPLSKYARESNFVYVGDGWFFSPYRPSREESILKHFLQYIEGTLFDWQIGDLMPSCEAGDIRVRYSVQDPKEISILGQLRNYDASRRTIEPIQTRNGRSVGLIHEGFHSPQDMIVAEDQDSLIWVALCRCMFLIWSFGIGRYIGRNFFDVDLENTTIPTQIACSLFIWCTFCGTLWLSFWSSKMDGLVLIVAAILFAMYIISFPPSSILSTKNEVDKTKND